MPDKNDLPQNNAGRPNMINMARTARSLIKILSGALVFLFGWLKLKGLDIGIAVQDITAEAILKLSLVAYFTCWVLGTNNDVSDQEIVNERAPNSGIIPPAGYLLAIVLALVFAGLCYVHNYRTFSLLLLLFWVINVAGWYYLVYKILDRDVNASLEQHKSNQMYYQYEVLSVAHEYMRGAWQLHRFGVGFLIILVNIALSYTNLSKSISSLFNIRSPDIVTAIGFVTYIVVMEVWIWLKRFRVRTSFHIIEDLTKKYNLYSNSA